MGRGDAASPWAGEAIVIVADRRGDKGSSLRGDLIVLAVLGGLRDSATWRARGSPRAATPSLPTTLWGVAGAALALLPLLAWTVSSQTGCAPGRAHRLGSILVLALLTSVLGYVAWYWALARRHQPHRRPSSSPSRCSAWRLPRSFRRAPRSDHRRCRRSHSARRVDGAARGLPGGPASAAEAESIA